MSIGRIKWFNMARGYGYIVLSNGQEIYFHETAIGDLTLRNFLQPGSPVLFDILETRVGFEAYNIRSS